MQQMQGPERQAYNEGYPESTGYQTYQDDEQVGGSQPQYESQQKMQPERAAKLSTTSYVMAILGVVASSLIMGLSIALVALTANIFGKVIEAAITDTLPYNVFGMIIGSFVVSLILLLISIAGFVFSIIQIAALSKQRKRARRATRSRPGY
jgi:hypothetical protein